ncbi:hypothetical protein [Sphingomonas sp. dw_22]|uniref:hypothetical protein n=1 Tax=Sphingomonas sp. dw_22 TaxID=2721175 RepID=UPI001BD59F06|nr:hypothetical protein [Sphingomonas sp. dw_22]
MSFADRETSAFRSAFPKADRPLMAQNGHAIDARSRAEKADKPFRRVPELCALMEGRDWLASVSWKPELYHCTPQGMWELLWYQIS